MGREEEKERNVNGQETHQPVGLPSNPGMCPGWESNQWPSCSRASAQSTKPHQPVLSGTAFNLSIVSSTSCIHTCNLRASHLCLSAYLQVFVLCSRSSLALWQGMLVALTQEQTGVPENKGLMGQPLTNGRWELARKCPPLPSFQWAVLRHILHCSLEDPHRIQHQCSE